MSLITETGILLKKEALLEWRTKNSVQAIFIYALATVFVCYWALRRAEPEVWNAVFWIIMIFSSINAVAKSFMQENAARQFYLYTLASPQAIILSKLIFNSGLMLLLSLSSLMLFALILGFPVARPGLFFLAIVIGSLNLAGIFTLLSAIASRAGNNMTLMAIMGIPLLMPVLFILIRLSGAALITGIAFGEVSNLIILVMLELVIVSLSLLVFPYI
jgi:heme exporter protein B